MNRAIENALNKKFNLRPLTASPDERTTSIRDDNWRLNDMTDRKALLPHQIEDARFLASKKVAGNFSGMGSGKTITHCEVAVLLNPSLTIIGCPPIAMNMWKANWEAQVGTPAQIIKTGKTPIDLSRQGAIIMSYSILVARVEELKKFRAGMLILDESHALKSIKAKRTKAILGRAGLIETVAHTYFLTGTPVTRWNDDIFSFLVRAANGSLKEKIGKIDADHFNLRYCVVQKRQFPGARFPTKMVVGNRNTDELNELIFDGGLAVRRSLKEVWAAMPPITHTRSTISLSKSAELSELLKAISKKSHLQIERDIAQNDESLSRTRRLMGVAKVEASVKVILERLESGSGPLLVGCWHTDVIDALQRTLKAAGKTVAVLDGRTSPKGKQDAQDAFNSGRLDVLVGQIAAMGVAIDLQHGGNNILMVEESFSPAESDQFYARMYRMGQANHVHVEILESDTPLDKAIRKIVARKRQGHATIMEQKDD